MTNPWDDEQFPAVPPAAAPWAPPNAPSGQPPHTDPSGPPTSQPGAGRFEAPRRSMPLSSGLPLGGTFADPTARPLTGPPDPFAPLHQSDPPQRRSRRSGRVLVAVLAATSLIGTGWIARDLAVEDTSATTPNEQAVNTAARMPSGGTTDPAADDDEPVAAVATALAPAVVQIGVGTGLGSGIVYDASGLILTNAHVVGASRTTTVTFNDGSTIDGTVLGSDELTDVAVVSVDPPEGLVVASIAAESPDVGDLAVAMGSPFGLQQSVTSGVVSAVGRVVSNPQGATVEMLQTDAPINPGNSGGALANRDGEVIGMNTLIYSESGENNGIGFAIPIQTAMEVASRIVNGESLDRGFLGVQSQQRTDGGQGALVALVQPGSPAAAAGIQVGDVVVAVDGEAVNGSPELAAAIQSHAPGDSVSITVERDAETVVVDVELAALEAD